jgi:uncharacterized cupin superfamily protein
VEIKKNEDVIHRFPEGKSEDNYPYSQSAKLFNTNQLFLYSEKVLPGRRASAPHCHESIDEIIYVIRG